MVSPNPICKPSLVVIYMTETCRLDIYETMSLNHFDQIKAESDHLDILTYQIKYLYILPE